MNTQPKTKLSWEQKAVLFGTYMVEKGAQSQTIKSYFSAIKHILRTNGYEWDDNSATLTIITKSCKIINDRVKIRLPKRVGLLEQLLFEINRKYNDRPFLSAFIRLSLVSLTMA